jgi:hypothetical protein
MATIFVSGVREHVIGRIDRAQYVAKKRTEFRVISEHLASPYVGRDNNAVAIEVPCLAHELFVWGHHARTSPRPYGIRPLVESLRGEKLGSWELD